MEGGEKRERMGNPNQHGGEGGKPAACGLIPFRNLFEKEMESSSHVPGENYSRQLVREPLTPVVTTSNLTINLVNCVMSQAKSKLNNLACDIISTDRQLVNSAHEQALFNPFFIEEPHFCFNSDFNFVNCFKSKLDSFETPNPSLI